MVCIKQNHRELLRRYLLHIYCSFTSRNRRTADLTEAAAVVEYTQAPPATVLLQRLQDQMPTTLRFIASYKKKKDKNNSYFHILSVLYNICLISCLMIQTWSKLQVKRGKYE